MKRTIENIRLKLLAPYIGSLLIILLCSYASMYFYQKQELNEFGRSIGGQLRNNFDQAIQEDIELISGLGFFISSNEKIQDAWLSQNRNALIAESAFIFRKYKQDHHITHFYFHDLTGTTFLRHHAPGHHGDKIDRPTMLRAMESGKTSTGLEFGAFGNFVLRVVIPWRIDDELVGYIELGEEIGHILERLSTNRYLEHVLTIDTVYLAENGLDETAFFRSEQARHNENPSRYVIHKTIDRVTPRLESILNSSANGVYQYSDAEKDYLVLRTEIYDGNDRAMAALSYLLDVTNNTAIQANFLRNIGIATIVTGMVLILFYFYYSKKLQTLLSTSFNKLRKEIRDRNEVQIELVKNKKKLEELVQEQDHSLKESEKRYRTLFDKSADALLIIVGNAFVDCNQATLDMLQYDTKEELYNTHPSKLSPEFQPDGQRSDLKADLMIETAFANGNHRFEWDHMRKNGEVFPVEVLLTAIPYEDSQLLHVVWRDITERKKAAAEIEYQAYYDHLTGLSNRKLLLDRLKQALITCRRHDHYGAILFIDLDRFKSINDSLGHSIGDALLVEAANRISSCIWDEDSASRFGGDEYVVLLRHIGSDKESASLTSEKVAQRIQDAFNQPFLIADQELHITVSIGIALFPFHEENVEDIIKHADTAMYSAKESGRNQSAFYLSDMHEKVINRLTLENDLRNAIRSNQLDVFYQPQISNQKKNQLGFVAVEALIRWNHPDHGFVSPDEFISIAEETGLIYEIGDFVLNRSITDILDLNRECNTKIKLAINISPRQFRKAEFIEQIKDIVRKYQIENDFITFELTEKIALENLNETIDKMQELKDSGIRLSLDDFGTGYSSLNHLKKLPIDELKIDKSFVIDIDEDPQDALLVQTIIKIAHQFSLDIVAEGVEVDSQLEFLKNEGCDIYQGYFFSEPLPLDQLRAYLNDIKDVMGF